MTDPPRTAVPRAGPAPAPGRHLQRRGGGRHDRHPGSGRLLLAHRVLQRQRPRPGGGPGRRVTTSRASRTGLCAAQRECRPARHGALLLGSAAVQPGAVGGWRYLPGGRRRCGSAEAGLGLRGTDPGQPTLREAAQGQDTRPRRRPGRHARDQLARAFHLPAGALQVGGGPPGGGRSGGGTPGS